MNNAEHVAYLRGLAEGLGLTGDQSQGGKFYEELLNCLEVLSQDFEQLKKEHDTLAGYVDQMDQALAEVEEELDPFYDDLDFLSDSCCCDDEFDLDDFELDDEDIIDLEKEEENK